jgi:RNA polymerase sigma-70 factor (ECF subfamily)
MTEKDISREAKLRQSANHATIPPPAPELEQIYRDHHRRVLNAAYRVTGNAQDAEDVLQTVFMRLVRREGGSPLSDSPGSYLHRAAINAALDIVRSRVAARTSPLEEVEAALSASASESPDRIHDAGEIRGEILQALARMSPKAAEVFVLRYFEGYGNHEIARMLGASRSTINVILHRTRQRLREEIASRAGEES